MQLSYSAAYHHVFCCTLKSNQTNKHILFGASLQSTSYSLHEWECDFLPEIIHLKNIKNTSVNEAIRCMRISSNTTVY